MRWLFRTPVLFGDPDVSVVQLRHMCSEECYSHDQWEVADTSMEKAAFAGTTYAKRFRELFTVGRLRRGTLGG